MLVLIFEPREAEDFDELEREEPAPKSEGRLCRRYGTEGGLETVKETVGEARGVCRLRDLDLDLERDADPLIREREREPE